MTPIQYLVGDATNPAVEPGKPAIIAHVCNDAGGWGAGFVLAISRQWPAPEASYRAMAGRSLVLGTVEFVPVGGGIEVANMIAQRGFGHRGGIPLSYLALGECLKIVALRAVEIGASVHVPRIGCGLAGGKWEAVEQLVRDSLSQRNVEVCVYDLPF